MCNCDVNAVIVQMRNMGAKYPSIQRYIKNEYNVDMSQQAIRGRYIANKDKKFSEKEAFKLILKGMTDGEICRELCIEKRVLYESLKHNEKEYNNQLYKILSTVADSIECGIDKAETDEYIESIIGMSIDTERMNDIYGFALRFYIENYLRKKKKYYKRATGEKISINDVLKKE